MDRTQDRQLIARLQAGDEAAVQELADALQLADLSAGAASHEEPGGRRGSHAGRAAEGVPEDRRVSRRCGAFILDLPHHVQHRDVAAAAPTAPARAAEQERDRALAAARDRASSRARRDSRPTGRGCRTRTLLRPQLRDAVAAAMRELPEIYRVPVVLRDIEGLTTEEASSRLNVKDQTLKSRLHRGRLMLRERLAGVQRAGLSLHQRRRTSSEPFYRRG